ncbi:MAG: RNase adapter RapZ [Acidobacteria bacterium]|nr:RNase adapter RapZ [Acidobacteriota bacterium]
MSYPVILIITGLSGSGKHSAVKAFEDLGYFCVDNLPIQLIPTFAELAGNSGEIVRRAALVVDIRERQFLPHFQAIYRDLKKRHVPVKVLFFEAADEALMRRFSETRRPHPLGSEQLDLPRAIERERVELKEIRALADLVVDTTDHSVHSLRQHLIDQFRASESTLEMRITMISFGFKHGVPHGLDLLLDTRFLTNPYFVPELAALTGRHPKVLEYLRADPETRETIDRYQDLLGFLLPKCQREGRSFFTIGVGCTGGRHRSVMVANELRRRLRKGGVRIRVTHRDIDKI